MKKKDKKIKTPPRGGDAAAAWEHHLKPDEKEALAQTYREEQARKLMFGKRLTRIIAAVNAVLAIVSIISFDMVVFCACVLMSVALFLGAPGIKFLFTGGAFLCVVILSKFWMLPGDTETYQTIFTIIHSACLIVSSLILLVDENISEYLYSKNTG